MKIYYGLFGLLVGLLLVHGKKSRPSFHAGVQTNDFKKFLFKQVIAETSQIANVTELLKSFKSSVSLTKGCDDAIVGLIDGILDGKYGELLTYIDASGKLVSGVEGGNYFFLGSFAECCKTPNAHYCTVNFHVNLHNVYVIEMPLGICLPTNCLASDIDIIIDAIGRVLEPNVLKSDSRFSNASVTGHHVDCLNGNSMNTGSIVTIIILGILISLCGISTFVDLYIVPRRVSKSSICKANCNSNVVSDEAPLLNIGEDLPKDGIIVKLLMCFSLRRNCVAILKTDVGAKTIGCVNGIRVISLFWIISGHGYIYALTTDLDDTFLTFDLTQNVLTLPFANAYVAVDSFFLLSGLLVCYLSLARFEKKKKFPFLSYYIHRYLRLTPTYAMIILIAIYIYPLLEVGPIWRLLSGTGGISNCQKNWWTNILYINNFYDKTEQCLEWTWYLANDMQFYAIAPAIIIATYYFKSLGLLIFNVIFFVGSFIITALLIHFYKLNTLLTKDLQSLDSLSKANVYTDTVYEKPYCRITPYLVGMILGYIFHRDWKPKQSYNKIIGLVGWVLAIVVALAVVLGPWKAFQTEEGSFTPIENIFYGTFSHFAWACSVAWVIYACHYNLGGIVNDILSWPGFAPLGRLTYSAYLLHPLIMKLYYSSLEVAFHYDLTNAVFMYFSFLSISYLAAFLVCLLIEYPFLALEKLLLDRR